MPAAPATVAEGFLSALAAHGVEYLFANGGTDFPPLIEGLARYAAAGAEMPKAVVVAHENLAVAMAHGHAMVSGRPQAVMVHVNVGTANAINGLLNAQRARVPLLLAAGRTPVTERGPRGARTRYIQWAQEMFDQGAMLREAVKWDMELRAPGQVGAAVDRALSIACASPAGPVYLTLPREVLAAPLPEAGGLAAPARRRMPERAAPAPEAVARAAEILGRAERPLVVTADAGRDPAAVWALGVFAERFAIPVVSHFPRHLCLPTDHAWNAGGEPGALIAEADAVLVLECDVPWIPSLARPPEDCRVVHAGPDPLYSRYPMRDFPCDVAIDADAARVLESLGEAMEAHADAARLARRRARVPARPPAAAPRADNSAAWIGHCLDAVKTPGTIVVSELGIGLGQATFTQPGTYFGSSPAGGLGWGLGAAIGAKLAAPERPVIAVVGDGSYMFGNPTPAHLAARTLDAPVLVVVVNNGKWNAVERATRAMYPDGAAARADAVPLTRFESPPAYEKVAEAGGAWAERVDDPGALPAALARAWKAATQHGRQALLNVVAA